MSLKYGSPRETFHAYAKRQKNSKFKVYLNLTCYILQMKNNASILPC
jgi:hypothetical protein